MPRLIITEGAVRGLERCHGFLQEKNPTAARRAAQAIDQRLSSLKTMPAIGRPFTMNPEWRELVIGFGDSGYIALYHHDLATDAVYVLAFRHQRESGY